VHVTEHRHAVQSTDDHPHGNSEGADVDCARPNSSDQPGSDYQSIDGTRDETEQTNRIEEILPKHGALSEQNLAAALSNFRDKRTIARDGNHHLKA
jgi:hypothetical protein